MRKPRGGQILANRVIGPREVLGGGDRRVPAKGRGRTEPHRGRSGASWIWSTPLHTGASEGEFRSGYALTPSPSHSKNISLFTERRTSERTVSEDGYSSFLFNPLWGFPVVAAGILFVVDQSSTAPTTERAFHSRPASPHPNRPSLSVSTFTNIRLRISALTTTVSTLVIFISSLSLILPIMPPRMEQRHPAF